MEYAIVGYGKMGKLYDQLLHCQYLIDQFPVNNRVYFSSIEEFIDYKPNVDLVIVCSSSNAHYYISRLLLLNNYNVLVEKPISLSSLETIELEKIARKKRLILYQSTLERYNPLIKFFKTTLNFNDIDWIESYRIGICPNRFYIEDAKFDLGIHDVDLFFYLVKKRIKWIAHARFGKPRREIIVHLKNQTIIYFDLLNKQVRFPDEIIDFKSIINNPILEMIKDINKQGCSINEKWSDEIAKIESSSDDPIILD